MGFVLVASANAWADLRADGLKSSSRILVAVVGPDWNPSSVKVREAFASPAFRRSFPKTLFGEFVVNEWTKPDEATVKGNAYTKSLVPSIHRYPTILIYDAKGRSQGRLENVPAELDGAALARRVRAPSERVEPLRLRKILVYGKPHW